MRRFASFAAVLAALVPHPHHTRGCRTHRCDIRVGRAWWIKHHPRPAMQAALASWFDDGITACRMAPMGFADLTGRCGERVRFCRSGRCVTGTRVDYGPASWTGKRFDLRRDLWNALGCPDTPCHLSWRPAR